MWDLFPKMEHRKPFLLERRFDDNADNWVISAFVLPGMFAKSFYSLTKY